MKEQDFQLLKLIMAIGNLDNNNERCIYYILNRNRLIDYNMIYVDLENGQDRTQYLNKFVEMNYDFNSLFYSNKLMVMNYDVVCNDFLYKPSNMPYQICVSFDLNIVSMLKGYNGKTEFKDEVLNKVIKICKEKKCAFDIMGYVIENFLKNKENLGLDDFAIKDIRNFEEMFPYQKSKYSLEFVDIETRMNQLLEMYNSDEFKEMCIYLYKEIYQLEYTYLLAIVHIFFKYRKLSSKHKLDKFIEFCVLEIKALHPCASNLAKLFYDDPNLKFFKRIQKNNKNIVATIENMAWDLFHLRFLEFAVETSHENKKIVLVPIFITKDNGLNEIRKAYQLKCLFQNIKTGKVIRSYYMNVITEDYVKKYSDDQSIKKRIEEQHDFNALSKKIEKMILDDIND